MLSPLVALIIVGVVFTGGVIAFVVYVMIDLSNVMEKARKEKAYKLSNHLILALAKQKSNSSLKMAFPQQTREQIIKKQTEDSLLGKE